MFALNCIKDGHTHRIAGYDDDVRRPRETAITYAKVINDPETDTYYEVVDLKTETIIYSTKEGVM